MNEVKYILFDLDGTLTDPKEGITKCVAYALNSYNIKVDNLDELEPFIGPPLKESFMEFYGFNEEDATNAVEVYRERFSTVGMFENNIYPGMKEMLKKLTDLGYVIGIASSKPTVFVEKICEHFDIKQYFHHIIGSYLDGRRTDKKEVLEDALKEFPSIKNRKIIMVGDRKFDIIGAKSHNLISIGVTYGYGGREELSGANADYIVDTVKDLETLLLEI